MSKARWFGVALIVVGIASFTHWWLIRDEEPIRNPSHYYGTSQQIVDLCYGVALTVIGGVAVRSGRWPR